MSAPKLKLGPPRTIFLAPALLRSGNGAGSGADRNRLFRRSCSAHMLWCVAGADVGQFSRIWSDVIRCGPMWSDAVISNTSIIVSCFVTNMQSCTL